MNSIPRCPTCCKSVYFAEEVRAIGRSYHKFCLKCTQCHKVLDSSSLNDHEDQLYCRTCYNKNFGPKGYGFASGGAGLSTEWGQLEDTGNRNSAVHNSNTIATGVGGRQNNSLLTSSSASTRLFSPNNKSTTVLRNQTNNSVSSPFPLNLSLRPGGGGPNVRISKYGGCVDSCGTCGKSVYHNERLDCAGRVFHRLCLKCYSCSKLLDKGSVNEHGGNIYCKNTSADCFQTPPPPRCPMYSLVKKETLETVADAPRSGAPESQNNVAAAYVNSSTKCVNDVHLKN